MVRASLVRAGVSAGLLATLLADAKLQDDGLDLLKGRDDCRDDGHDEAPDGDDGGPGPELG